MKTFTFLAALVLPVLASASATSAIKPENGFGVGFVLGTPSGLSASLPLGGGTRAINGVLGYDLGHGSALYAQADHVWIRGDLFEITSGKASLYYGPGVFTVLTGDASAVGIRFVGGVDYRFQDTPVQIFLEIGPGINVLPNTSATGTGGLGLRYYF